MYSKAVSVVQGLLSDLIKSSRVEVAPVFCITNLSSDGVLPLHLTRLSLLQLWRLKELPIENTSPAAAEAARPCCV